MAHKNKSNISPYKTRQEKRGPRSKPSELKGKHRVPDKIFSVDEANDRLFDIFKNHGFSHISHVERRALAQFYVLLMENQKKENFTRLLTLRDTAIRQFIDCLIVRDLTKLKFPLIDVGTGPGFPGIPLKVLFPKEKIILAEGVQRRVEFLKFVRSELNLPNLDIIGRNINPFFAYPVQGVITRAVEDVRNTLKNVLTCLQTGGRVYLMKGPNVDPEIPVAAEEMGEYYKLVEDHAYTLPHTQFDRRLLVYEKIKMGPLVDFDEEPWPEDEHD
ncbi:MAG: class I SAM-dependent methyltransferase [Proteobacteria bacterium]|jgi:16S rRNA (guanine527-N7)-methyltransferase|nr:class I SAM-dependent methyltransferase [Pseudomonadota bacterium]